MVRDAFELEALPPQTVKGVDGPIAHYRIVAERDITTTARGPLVGRERELGYFQRSWAQAKAGTLSIAGSRVPRRGRNRQNPACLCRRRHGPAGTAP